MTTKQTIVLFLAMLPIYLPAADSTNRLRFPLAGFSIAALESPPGPTPHMPLTMSLPADDKFAANVNIQIQPYEGTIEEYEALTLRQFKDFGLKVIERKKVGKLVIVFQYSGEVQGRLLHLYARAEKSGDHVYLVTATAVERQWVEQAPKLKACVDSFQCEKGEQVALPNAAAPHR
jgi:hypothetical protein